MVTRDAIEVSGVWILTLIVVHEKGNLIGLGRFFDSLTSKKDLKVA